MDRDNRGRFINGNCAAKGKGRPRARCSERMEELLASALNDKLALEEWMTAFKRKLARADPWATEFLWDRLVGKVAARQEVAGVISEPVEVVVRYVTVPLPECAEVE
jgi:hypothetical protein